MIPVSMDSNGKPGIFVEDGIVFPDATVVVIVVSKG